MAIERRGVRIRGNGSRDSRREGKRNRQPVGHPNDDVAHRFRRGEMMFRVWRGGHAYFSNN
jgi:hypothetical protein